MDRMQLALAEIPKMTEPLHYEPLLGSLHYSTASDHSLIRKKKVLGKH